MCCVDFMYIYSFKYTNLNYKEIIVILKNGRLVTLPRLLRKSYLTNCFTIKCRAVCCYNI